MLVFEIVLHVYFIKLASLFVNVTFVVFSFGEQAKWNWCVHFIFGIAVIDFLICPCLNAKLCWISLCSWIMWFWLNGIVNYVDYEMNKCKFRFYIYTWMKKKMASSKIRLKRRKLVLSGKKNSIVASDWIGLFGMCSSFQHLIPYVWGVRSVQI